MELVCDCGCFSTNVIATVNTLVQCHLPDGATLCCCWPNCPKELTEWWSVWSDA